MRPEVVGTWWYACNDDGSTYVVKTKEKPKPDKGGWTYTEKAEVTWLQITKKNEISAFDHAFSDNPKYRHIQSNWFDGVKFPSMDPMTCHEIEIVASGNVYVYD